MVILVGDYYRSISRRELSDLHELHELSRDAGLDSRRCPTSSSSSSRTFARMHGADAGLISILDPARDATERGGQHRASARARSTRCATCAASGAVRLACVDKARVVIEDTERDPRFAELRELARARRRARGACDAADQPRRRGAGRADGALCSAAHGPREREIRIADICARKAAVFIERARAEELREPARPAFPVGAESSGVPFVDVVARCATRAGKIVDFRWSCSSTPPRPAIMRCKPARFRRPHA